MILKLEQTSSVGYRCVLSSSPATGFNSLSAKSRQVFLSISCDSVNVKSDEPIFVDIKHCFNKFAKKKLSFFFLFTIIFFYYFFERLIEIIDFVF